MASSRSGDSIDSRRSSGSRDVDRRMSEARLKMLQEKLASEKQKAARNKYREVAGRDPDGGQIGDLDAEIQLARLRHTDLRNQMERERQLAEKLADRPRNSSVGHATRRSQSPRERRGDRFSEMMEMMMMQNSQVHNMILNQMLMKQTLGDSPSYRAAPSPPQPAQPMPIYIPMPMFPPYPPPQQQPQQIVEYRSKPGTPAAAAKAEEAKAVKKSSGPYPFPGNDNQQKLRWLAYAAFFVATLDRWTRENKFRPTNDFLFDLKLKEILETLHRIYKAPDGQLYNITISTVMGAEAAELTELLNSPKTLSIEDERSLTTELSYCIENTVFQITDIMPSSGILGTHRKSGIFEMMRTGNLYPRGYFYDMERKMLDFDEDGRTSKISDADGQMLIIGMFLTRALVETLYLKTEHYGMVDETSPKAERNTRLVASILMYIYRRLVGQLSTIDRGGNMSKAPLPELPPEMREVLYSDAEIKPVLKLIKKSLDYAEQLLMQWSQEYMSRLREAAF
ncbi:hypothetical protein BOX15_Mlig022147g2 [Macrostomum lignano]|uniref:NR LBD domain-containing protein n=2 Tax=Macrostomum lignano TaxID=282301 RepID=A0A1I8HBJ3_9PLAT|nr:hypothetical protein BOX15_Mlig022147g2 [Macrostomum lignano]